MDSQGSPVSRRVVGPNSCPGSFVGKLASEYLGGTREDVEPVTETGQSCIKGRGLGGCLATARLRRTTGLELHSSGSVDVDGRSQTEKRASHVAVQVAVCIGVPQRGAASFAIPACSGCTSTNVHQERAGFQQKGRRDRGPRPPCPSLQNAARPVPAPAGWGTPRARCFPRPNVLALDTFLGCSWNLLRSF